MKINRHNLTIVTHCATKALSGYITNGLQFTDKGTIAINGAYSVAVSALQVGAKEAVPACITPEYVGELLETLNPEGEDVSMAHLPRMTGTPAKIIWLKKPAAFEIYLNADFLFKLAQSARDFCEPTADEDAVVRIQFTANDEPVRMDARNTKTGQKWEALLMPRKPATDDARFAAATPADIDAQRQSAYEHGAIRGERQAIVIPPPPPPVEEDDFTKALRIATGMGA